MSISVNIKWGKEILHVEVDPSEPLDSFKKKIQELTRVPLEKQKIIGLKPGGPSASLSSLGLTSGKPLVLIGSPEGTAIPIQISAPVGTEKNGGEYSPPAVHELNGLANLGNTCYFNSAIQLLRSIPELKDFLQEYSGSNTLLKSMGSVLQRLSTDVNQPTIPADLLMQFQQKFPQFRETDESNHLMQQDAHEALNALLQEIIPALPHEFQYLFCGELHQAVSVSLPSTLPHRDKDSSGPSQAQENASALATSTTATSNAPSNTEQKENIVPFTIISCNISGEVQTIEAALEKAFNEEFTTTNEATHHEEKRTSVSRVAKAPEYLLIHIVRFSWRSDVNKKTKMLKSISFPAVLDIQRFVTPELETAQNPIRQEIKSRLDADMEKRKRLRNDSKPEEESNSSAEAQQADRVPSTLQNESGFYELCGVISHKGRHADGGHYVYWGKRGGRWVVYDDTNAGLVSEEDVLRLRGIGESHIAYVLLYRSRDPVTKKAVSSY